MTSTPDIPDTQYEQACKALQNSITLGIRLEREDPNMLGSVPDLNEKQIAWLAAWLAGDGFDQPGDDG